MRNKLTLLIKEGLKQKIKTKVFIISQIIMLFFIVFITNIATVIRMMDNNNKPVQVKNKIYVVDETKMAYDLFEKYFYSYADNPASFEIISAETIDEVMEQVSVGSWIVQITPSLDSFIEFTLYSRASVNTYDMGLIEKSANSVKKKIKLDSMELSEEDYIQLSENAVINTELIEVISETEKKEVGTDLLLNLVLIYVFIPIIVIITMAMATIGADINDEKATRVMDFIMVNVKAKTHLTAKLIVGYVFAAVQILMVIIDLSIARMVSNMLSPSSYNSVNYMKHNIDAIMASSASEMLIYLIPILLAFIILNAIVCAIIAGVFASMSTTNGEYQQIQLPMVMFLFSNLIVAMIALSFDNIMLAKVLAFIPFLSVNLAPCLLIMGEIGVLEALCSLFIMSGTTLLLIKYGLKIYRIGVLDYSKKNLWEKIIKAVAN